MGRESGFNPEQQESTPQSEQQDGEQEKTETTELSTEDDVLEGGNGAFQAEEGKIVHIKSSEQTGTVYFAMERPGTPKDNFIWGEERYNKENGRRKAIQRAIERAKDLW